MKWMILVLAVLVLGCEESREDKAKREVKELIQRGIDSGEVNNETILGFELGMTKGEYDDRLNVLKKEGRVSTNTGYQYTYNLDIGGDYLVRAILDPFFKNIDGKLVLKNFGLTLNCEKKHYSDLFHKTRQYCKAKYIGGENYETVFKDEYSGSVRLWMNVKGSRSIEIFDGCPEYVSLSFFDATEAIEL